MKVEGKDFEVELDENALDFHVKNGAIPAFLAALWRDPEWLAKMMKAEMEQAPEVL